MEQDHLLAPGDDDVRNVALASNSFKGYCVPTCKRHKQKAKVGFRPNGMLLRVNGTNRNSYNLINPSSQPAAQQMNDSNEPRCYIDDNQRKWYERKSCCSCKNDRLVCYDAPLIPDSQGSSELAYIVMDDGSFSFNSATYYYRDRDKSTCCQHFWADIFPIFCYCHCATSKMFDGAEGYTSVESPRGDN